MGKKANRTAKLNKKRKRKEKKRVEAITTLVEKMKNQPVVVPHDKPINWSDYKD